ncbi:peptidoglycan-binding domain-containing protein [Crocosphaera sp.]|uniref:peptidoglycan-binding domain-containing protein n=1 Tax=Crocosphaera sp. TaxID=2729996 RepID=UPI00262F13F1|nr:peptidoglycan-binding domain-containing protein [Crocosphaera sp.]MDJ0581079.1 peptidoglycan-binding domain-containing protein [Crocosphaera sp.]
MIGYRYFWLKKPENTNIDGVGTLLQWWISKSKPCLDLKPHSQIQETQKNNYQQGYYKAKIYQKNSFNDYDKTVENISNQITKTPHIFTVKKYKENNQLPKNLQKADNLSNLALLRGNSRLGLWLFSVILLLKWDFYCLQLHSLALYLNKKYQLPIAWTWNISCLENPNKYILIGCADQQSFEWNQKYNNISTPLEQEISIPKTQESVQKTPTNTLKQAIHKIAENKQVDKHLETLIEELSHSDSVQWDWGKLVDKTWLETHNESQIARYKSLVLLLHPNLKIENLEISTPNWINSFNKVNEQDKKKKSNKYYPPNENAINALEIQSKPQLKAAISHSEKLRNKVNYIIDQLLLEVLNSEDNYRSIEWLLFESQSVWSDEQRLISYGKKLLEKLKKKCKDKQELTIEENNEFIEQISKDFQSWEDIKEQEKRALQNQNLVIHQPNSSHNIPSVPSSNSFNAYEKLAKFFGKIDDQKTYSVAAFFYQLSRQKIPKEIKKYKLDEIIPLKSSQKEEQKINYDLSVFGRNFFKYYSFSNFSKASHLTKLAIFNSSENLEILLIGLVPFNHLAILKKCYPMFAILVSYPSVTGYFERSFNQMWKLILGLSIGSSFLLGTFVGIGLGIPIQGWFKGYDKILYDPISQNESKIISSNPIRELYLYLNLLESGYFKKDVQQKNLDNLDKLISLIPKFTDTKFKKAETREQILKDRNNLTKNPLYGYIKGLTPPVKQQLSQSYKTDQINEETLLKSLEIKQVKDVLDPLGFYKGKKVEINEIWDKQTSDALKEFQKDYGIDSVDGSLGPDTWSVLSIMIEAKQLEEAAQELNLIIDKSKNYEEFKIKYNKLNECKIISDKLYSECLKEEPKKPKEKPKIDKNQEPKT